MITEKICFVFTLFPLCFHFVSTLFSLCFPPDQVVPFWNSLTVARGRCHSGWSSSPPADTCPQGIKAFSTKASNKKKNFQPSSCLLSWDEEKKYFRKIRCRFQTLVAQACDKSSYRDSVKMMNDASEVSFNQLSWDPDRHHEHDPDLHNHHDPNQKNQTWPRRHMWDPWPWQWPWPWWHTPKIPTEDLPVCVSSRFLSSS